MRRCTGLPWLLAGALFLTGCGPANVATNDRDTGGGGISANEGHSSRIAGGSGTGSSSAAIGVGPVAGSGAQAELGNAQSPTESNGGNTGTARQ